MALSEEVKARICTALAEGKSLVKTLAEPGMPARSKVYELIAADPEFRDRYARAKMDGIESMADDIMAISDETAVENVYDSDGNLTDVRLDSTAVARNRLRVDTRKWLLSKLAPKKYGDKLETTVTGELIHKTQRVLVDPAK